MSECKHTAPTIKVINKDLTISFCEDCNKLMWEIRAEEFEESNLYNFNRFQKQLIENESLKKGNKTMEKKLKNIKDKIKDALAWDGMGNSKKCFETLYPLIKGEIE